MSNNHSGCNFQKTETDRQTHQQRQETEGGEETDRQTEGGGETDRQTDRQTDRETETEK